MLLSEIFEYLTHGELAQLSLGGGGTDEIGIAPVNYPKVITNINLGLIELHKRFPIKQDEVAIQLYSHITTYYLRKEYAQSNTESQETYKYIMDATLKEPFSDNVVLIRHVYDEVGDEFSLNDVDDTVSLYTPQQDVLQVPYPDNENTLSIIYRAGPNKIQHVGLSQPETITVELSQQFIAPLVSYVAHRIFLSLNTPEGTIGAITYLNKFENECKLIIDLGMAVAESNANLKFQEGGWV